MGLGGLLQALTTAGPITREPAELRAQHRMVLLGAIAVAIYPLAGWKRSSYRCQGRSRTADAAPRQVLAYSGHVSARLATSQRRQALRDARDRVGVTKDFQGHLQASRSPTDSKTASGSPL
jgi:hypothetical protein